MAKKLMMNNAENGKMPIKKGLVCWLDGRDYTGGNSVKDRVNGKEFTVNGVSVSGYSFFYNNDTNAVISAKVGVEENLYNLFNSDFTLVITDKLIKKIVAGTYPRLFNFGEYPTNSPYQLIYQPDNHYNCLQFCDRSIVANSLFKNTTMLTRLDRKTIVIAKKGNEITIYHNGVKHTTIADSLTPAILNLTKITLGQAHDATNIRVYYGHICSFMMYNRALTEEEVQHNYLYEQSIERGE